MATDVLAMIDGALRDYETGADAMRWTPRTAIEAPKPIGHISVGNGWVPVSDGGIQLVRAYEQAARAVRIDIQVDIEQFAAALRLAAETVNRALKPLAAPCRQLASAAEVIAEARRERLSAMHRECHRRQRGRRRRRRR